MVNLIWNPARVKRFLDVIGLRKAFKEKIKMVIFKPGLDKIKPITKKTGIIIFIVIASILLVLAGFGIFYIVTLLI
jgi:hypothetical protein